MSADDGRTRVFPHDDDAVDRNRQQAAFDPFPAAGFVVGKAYGFFHAGQGIRIAGVGRAKLDFGNVIERIVHVAAALVARISAYREIAGGVVRPIQSLSLLG